MHFIQSKQDRSEFLEAVFWDSNFSHRTERVWRVSDSDDVTRLVVEQREIDEKHFDSAAPDDSHLIIRFEVVELWNILYEIDDALNK